MFIQQLFEGEIKRVIAIYPGRFQPFHLGHKEVFETLQAKFGMDNVFIGTSNKTDAVKSPFNFSDKLQLMTAAGINNHHVIEVSSPYMPDDYIRAIGFNPAETVLIFAVGAPDLKRLEVDAHYTALTPTGRPSKIPDGKSVGDPKPFKTFKSLQDCETADQHQYVLIVNEREKKVVVNGKEFDASHGTQVRQLWNEVRNDPKASAQVLQQLYGRATPELAHIFNKIPDANAAPAPVPAAAPKLKAVKQPKQDVSKELKEAMLTEAMLQEAFLDSIKQTLGNAVNVHVTNVTNATQALQVLYRVVSDPKYLDTMSFLLKKRLKDIIKSLPTNIRIAVKLKEFLNSMFPEGRTLGDFFKALLLVALGKSGLAIAMTIKNEAQEALLASIIEAIKQIPQFAGSILSGGAGAIGNVLQSLKIGNAIWFELLTYLNSKIEYANTLGTNRNPAMAEDAAGVGVIANKKQKNDPRYSMSMTQDVGPGEDKKNMKKLHLEGNRGYAHGFASPTAPSLGRRGREDDEYHVPDPTPSTWYIRADGKIIKDKMGTPFQYRDKETARKAAMTMMAKPFNAGKKFMLTTKPQDDAPVAEDAGTVTHRIGLTVTDPNHPMVSKRGETYQKTVRVKGPDREKAINGAIAHARRKGYKVHDHHYIGTVDSETMAEAGKGISKDAETKFHAKLDKLVHDTFGRRDSEQGMAEGVAESMPLNDALKVLRQYGAENLKTTTNELHFYKNGKAFSVPLTFNDDATRSVSLSQLNSATRGLKGQGVAEGSKYKCSCHPGDPDPDCPVHGLEPMGVGDALDIKKGVAEGAELKQAKRKYNQAAKDANDDQVGAGKKIDTMKKSLRQKDVDNKKQGMAEGKKSDNYHIVDKDGKPASLASYADRASAEKDRDAKHPGAQVRQVGPRGKVKGVSEGGIATVGWPDEGNHTGNNPPVSVGGTFPARPVVKKGSLVKASGLSGVYRVMDILRDEAKIVQEIPMTGQSTYVPMTDLRVWTNKPIVREQGMLEDAEELSVGDPVIITGRGIEFEGKTGDVYSFGDNKRFVIVDLYNHGKHSFHSSDVSYNNHADREDEVDESMYQYDAQDPYNSEFAPDVGMGRMTLRGWKQSLARRVAQLAQEMEQSTQGGAIDKAALWDNVYRKMQSLNLDPIAQEIELAHQELENIRRKGGVRSRAFK